MTIKESFDVAGLPTTWGRPELKDNVPARDALAVERLKRAGAVLFGKTNVPTAAGRLADLQRHLRHHQQPLGHLARAGWILRRRRPRRWRRV